MSHVAVLRAILLYSCEIVACDVVAMEKEQAIAFIKDQISKIRSVPEDELYQSGYVVGLTNAFLQVGLLTEDESAELLDLLTLEVRCF